MGVPFQKTLELRVQVLIKRQNRVLTIPTMLRRNVVSSLVLAFIDKYRANSKTSRRLPLVQPFGSQEQGSRFPKGETMPAIDLD
jgi:hypothetical protein